MFATLLFLSRTFLVLPCFLNQHGQWHPSQIDLEGQQLPPLLRCVTRAHPATPNPPNQS
uniref:Uncharacterized protein n=1 Tax=Arundo donax TaxID=35708 RepID=A0A0A9EMK5_ARUDO